MSTSGGSSGTGTISDITSSSPGGILTIGAPTGPTTDIESALPIVESYRTTNVTFSATVPINIASVALGAGTWIVIARCDLFNSGTGNSYAEFYIGPNSASLTAAYASQSTSSPGSTLGDTRISLCLAKEVVLAAPTTVYFGAASNGAAVDQIIAASAVNGIPNASGITAIRVA